MIVVPVSTAGTITFGLGTLRGAANLGQGTVPKVDPRLDATTCRAQNTFGSMRRVRHQTFEQLTPHRAMTIAIQFDMPVNIVDEIA
jgi:hypothetical protein